MPRRYPKAIVFSFFCFLCICFVSNAQNPFVKCYFNKPINSNLSTGLPAQNIGSAFPDTIAAYIDRAKSTLDIAVFSYTTNGNDSVIKIARAVNNAYKRGVKVRWIYNGSSSNTGLPLLNKAIPTLGSPTSGNYGIMHNKFLAIDVDAPTATDAIVITGSYNFSMQQAAIDYNNLLIIQDKAVAKAYQTEFNKMWGGTSQLPDTTKNAFGPYKKSSPNHYFNVGGALVQVHFSPKDTADNYLDAVANSANKDVTFGIYAFTDNTLANIISAKSKNKLTVRGVMDAFSKTYSPYTTLSAQLGKNLALYTGTGLFHSKVMVVDALDPLSDPQVATGSFNWSNAAATSNDENLVIVHDAGIVNQYYQALCKDITDLGATPCVSPLPIKWISFELFTNIDQTILKWRTIGDEPGGRIEIEKSMDGFEFENIGVTASNETGEYKFVDAKNLATIAYYRLKAIDIRGEIQYSKTILARRATVNSFSIAPLPCKGNLSVSAPMDGKTLVSIATVDGRTLLTSELYLKNGKATLDISRLASGTYRFLIQHKDWNASKLLIKQ